jgi:RimJ/RimL family protein N-acetyltransferase
MDGSDAWDLDDALGYGRELLRGKRVRLREARESDFEQLTRWWADPQTSVFQSNYLRPTPAPTVSDMMRAWGANIGADTGFAIVTHDDGDDSVAGDGADDEGELIGQISLFGVTKNRCGTLGVVIGREHWGDGLGTEAVRLMVGYGFAEMALHRVELAVYAYNDRALRSYASVGFREEGRRKENAFHGGRWHDEVFMAILEDDWRADNP